MSNGRSALGERSVSPETEELGLHARLDRMKHQIASADFSPQGDGIALVAKMAILTTKLAEIRRHREEVAAAPPVDRGRRENEDARSKPAKEAPRTRTQGQPSDGTARHQDFGDDERADIAEASRDSQSASGSASTESSVPKPSNDPPSNAPTGPRFGTQDPPRTIAQVRAQIAAINKTSLTHAQKKTQKSALWREFEQQKKDAAKRPTGQIATGKNLPIANQEPRSSPCVQVSSNKQQKQPEHPVDIIGADKVPLRNATSNSLLPQPDKEAGKGKAKVSNDVSDLKPRSKESVPKPPNSSPAKGRLLSQAFRPTPERAKAPAGGETSASGAKRNMSQYDRFYLDNYLPPQSKASQSQSSPSRPPAADKTSSKEAASLSSNLKTPQKSARQASVIEVGSSSEEQTSNESSEDEGAQAAPSEQKAPDEDAAAKDEKVAAQFDFGFTSPKEEKPEAPSTAHDGTAALLKRMYGIDAKDVDSGEESDESTASSQSSALGRDVAYNLTLAKTTTPRTRAGPMSQMLARSRDSSRSQQQPSQAANGVTKASSAPTSSKKATKEGTSKVGSAAGQSSRKSQSASSKAKTPKPSSATGPSNQKSQLASSAPATYIAQPGESSAIKALREFNESQAQVPHKSNLTDATNGNEPQGKRRKRASSSAPEHVVPTTQAPSQPSLSPAKASVPAGPPAKKQKTQPKGKKADAPSSQPSVGATGFNSSPYSGVASHISEIFKLTGQPAATTAAAAPAQKPAKKLAKKSAKPPKAHPVSPGATSAGPASANKTPGPPKPAATSNKKGEGQVSSNAKSLQDDVDETSSSGSSEDSDDGSDKPLAETAKKRTDKSAGHQPFSQTNSQKVKSPTQASNKPKQSQSGPVRKADARVSASAQRPQAEEAETLSESDSSDSHVSSPSFVPDRRESRHIDDPKTPVTRSRNRSVPPRSSPPVGSPSPDPAKDLSTQVQYDQALADFRDALYAPKSGLNGQEGSSASGSQGSKKGPAKPGQVLSAVYVSPSEMPTTQALIDGISPFPSSSDKHSTGLLGSAKKWLGSGASNPTEKPATSTPKSQGKPPPRGPNVATSVNTIPIATDRRRTRINPPAAILHDWRSPPVREMTDDTDFEPLPAGRRPPATKGTQTTPRPTPRSILKNRGTTPFPASSPLLRSSPPATPRSALKNKGKAPLQSPFREEEREDQEAIEGAIDWLQTPECIKSSSSLGLTQAARDVARAEEKLFGKSAF